MARRSPKPFIVQMQIEGTKAERDLIKTEILLEAKRLAAKMPTLRPDRLIYVRNLTIKTLRKEVDLEVFKEFIKLTNSWIELQECAPRAKILVERK